MGIKIVLPKGHGERTGMGTKVFTDEGVEIAGISNIQISLNPNEMMTAVVTVNVSTIENLNGINGIVIVREHDYKGKSDE
jgi:hypothetical protein